MQYTVRNVPSAVDELLRRRAHQENKSLNEVLLDALARAVGLGVSAPVAQRDLSDLAGSWKADPLMDAVLDEQRAIDADLWK